MSKKDAKLFFDEVKKNKELKAKIDKAEVGNEALSKDEARKFFNEKLVPIIKEAGFNFSYEDLIEYKRDLVPEDIEELDDEFLSKVAGGRRS